jgi:hypothetical protein
MISGVEDVHGWTKGDYYDATRPMTGVFVTPPLPTQADTVNSPPHYTQGTIEAIDYLNDNMPFEAFLGGLEWNVKKYLHRWRYKGSPVNDLKKARWYLDKLIQTLEPIDGVKVGL